MAIFDWGDGRTYSDLPSALAGAAAVGLTLTEDYLFPGYGVNFNQSGNISIPAFNTTSGTYKVKIYGTSGSVAGKNLVKITFDALSNDGLDTNSMSSTGLYISGLHICNLTGSKGVYLGSAYSSVSDCIIEGPAYGIYCAGVPKINRCYIEGNIGISVYNSNGGKIDRCVIRGRLSDGESSSRNFLTFSNCLIYGNTYGISQVSPFRTMVNCVVVGGIYAVNSVPAEYNKDSGYFSNVMFYSEANPSDVSSAGDLSATFGNQLDSYNNLQIDDPEFGKMGTLQNWFDPGLTSPLRVENQSFETNTIFGTNLDKVSVGAWSDATAPDFPSVDSVLETDTVNNVPGTYHELTIAEVQDGVLFGPNSSYEGTYDNSTDPDFVLSSQGGNWDDTSLTDAVIQLGINYGLGSTGTLSLAVPPTPTLVSLVAGDGQFTATFTGTGTIKVAYRVTGTGAWSYDTQSVVGDGSITVTGITNSATYQAFTYALVAGAPSYPSNVMYVIPRSATCQFNSNPDWPRWIFASICKHFDDCKGNYDVFIEGQYRNSDIKKDFFELRIDGPYITEVNKNYYNLYLEVNVLVQSQMDDTNYHRIHTDVGYAASLFRNISLYKYGNGVNDTQELFGCLELLQDTQTRKRVQINHFGQIDPKVRLTQATVEGHYEVFLQGE